MHDAALVEGDPRTIRGGAQRAGGATPEVAARGRRFVLGGA